MITTLIFDLNKVLVTYENIDLSKEFKERLGVEQKYFWDVAWKYYRSFNIGEISLDEWLDKTFIDLGLDKSLKPVVVELHDKQMQPVHGMRKILSSIVDKKMILLAGDGHEFIKSKVYGMGFDKYFDRVYATCEEGLGKTNPKIYEKVLSENNLLPEECLFIDDSPDFIEVAKKIGINTITFIDCDNLRKELTRLEIL